MYRFLKILKDWSEENRVIQGGHFKNSKDVRTSWEMTCGYLFIEASFFVGFFLFKEIYRSFSCDQSDDNHFRSKHVADLRNKYIVVF